jgi:hypothetical protein
VYLNKVLQELKLDLEKSTAHKLLCKIWSTSGLQWSTCTLCSLPVYSVLRLPYHLLWTCSLCAFGLGAAVFVPLPDMLQRLATLSNSSCSATVCAWSMPAATAARQGVLEQPPRFLGGSLQY